MTVHIMNNILTLENNCCGCGVCADVCPQNAIAFEYSREGFYYPYVSDSCVGCNTCTKHCPIFTESQEPTMEKVYAAYLKDSEKVHTQSTAGGVFATLAMEFLQYGGVVFGCALDTNLVATHIGVENMSELKKLQGTKYVQSNTLGIYPQVKEALEQDRYVLYSGTPCQVDALRSYLKKGYPKLLTVDIICSGVPSPKLFENYLNYLEIESKSKVKEYYFRNKEKKGWGHNIKYVTMINEKNKNGYKDPYYNAYVQGQNYRECCYNCKYATPNRVGDITVGDYFGVEKEHPQINNPKGVSAVIINNEKGEFFWEQIAHRLEIAKSSYKKVAKKNPTLMDPSPRKEERNSFYQGFNEDILMYFGETLKPDFSLKQTVKEVLPPSAVNFARKILRK